MIGSSKEAARRRVMEIMDGLCEELDILLDVNAGQTVPMTREFVSDIFNRIREAEAIASSHPDYFSEPLLTEALAQIVRAWRTVVADVRH